MLFLKYEEMQKVCDCFTQIFTVLDRVSPTRTLLLGQRIMRRKIMMTTLTTIMMSIILNISINLLVVYRGSVNLIGYITRRLSADSLQF